MSAHGARVLPLHPLAQAVLVHICESTTIHLAHVGAILAEADGAIVVIAIAVLDSRRIFSVYVTASTLVGGFLFAPESLGCRGFAHHDGCPPFTIPFIFDPCFDSAGACVYLRTASNRAQARGVRRTACRYLRIFSICGDCTSLASYRGKV